MRPYATGLARTAESGRLVVSHHRHSLVQPFVSATRRDVISRETSKARADARV